MKKIITISIFVMLVAFATLSTTVNAAGVPENTAVLCADGIDNDFNTLADLADPSCASFAPVPAAPAIAENTAVLCADGIDNDFNTLADLADPACAPFAPVPAAPVLVENTAALCSDGIDNNFNTLADLADPSCAPFAPVAPTPSTGGGIFGGGMGTQPVTATSTATTTITSGTPISTVVATSTPGVCDEMITTFIKKGAKNDSTEVKKLQAFLNKNLGLKISTTGFYGTATFNAVKKFQAKYKPSVLNPWGITDATGYFYKTTQRQANLLLCPAAEIPMPVLN